MGRHVVWGPRNSNELGSYGSYAAIRIHLRMIIKIYFFSWYVWEFTHELSMLMVLGPRFNTNWKGRFCKLVHMPIAISRHKRNFSEIERRRWSKEKRSMSKSTPKRSVSRCLGEIVLASTWESEWSQMYEMLRDMAWSRASLIARASQPCKRMRHVLGVHSLC